MRLKIYYKKLFFIFIIGLLASSALAESIAYRSTTPMLRQIASMPSESGKSNRDQISLKDYLELFDQRIIDASSIAKIYHDQAMAEVLKLHNEIDGTTSKILAGLAAFASSILGIGYFTISKVIKRLINAAVEKRITNEFVYRLVQEKSAEVIKNTSDQVTLIYQGLSQYNTGDYEGAYHSFTESELKGKNSIAKSHLAFLAYKLGKPEAGAQFEELKQGGVLSDIDVINYSFYLRRVKRNNLLAIEELKKALGNTPESIVIRANLVCAQIIETKLRETALDNLRDLVKVCSSTGAVELELRFVSLVYENDMANEMVHYARIVKLLHAGVRSRYWDFDSHIEQCRSMNHQKINTLKILAAAITSGQSFDMLPSVY